MDGTWYQVAKADLNTLVVNIGEIINSMSDERFKPVIHRVVALEEDRQVFVATPVLGCTHGQERTLAPPSPPSLLRINPTVQRKAGEAKS